jgi:fluoroquinolone resistance protein
MTLYDDEIFEAADYSSKVIARTEYQSCTFKRCDFGEADLSGSRFVDCKFDSCNLSMVKLGNTTLNDATFKNCKMLGVNFKDASSLFFNVNFDGCILDYASFMDKKMLKTKFIKTSLKEVNFSGTILIGSLFDECDLNGAVFNRSDLGACNFITAYNFDIDPQFNNIKKAAFSAAGLPGLLSSHQLKIV